MTSNCRIPKAGEGWRHYKGGLYEIVGTGHDEDGAPVVVYKQYAWTLAQAPALYTRKFDSWFSVIDDPIQCVNRPPRKMPRFTFERESGS